MSSHDAGGEASTVHDRAKPLSTTYFNLDVCNVTSFSENSSSGDEGGLSHDAQGMPVRIMNDGYRRRHRRYRRHRTPTARLVPVLDLVHQLQDKVPTLVTVEDAAAVPTFITTPDDPS
jgi:hypothetical protein